MGRFSCPPSELSVQYDKPHLTYEQLVHVLEDRGMRVDDFPEAIRVLKRVGYYRLSAYTYVLRAPSPDGTPSSTRSSQFVDGARFEDAVQLCEFDSRLRTVVLAGLQTLELGLRVRIGHELGKIHPHAHMNSSHLDPAQPEGAHARWLEKYRELLHEGRNEEYVTHFLVKYDGQLPVWAATEVMTFGCLTALFALMPPKPASKIATDIGASGRDPLHAWMRALNVLRNNCAHNARIWNRTTIYPPAKTRSALEPDRISHLRSADNNKLYFLCALAAHLLRNIDRDSQWPSSFVTAMRKFPAVNGMTPQTTMGFPADWESLDLWRR